MGDNKSKAVAGQTGEQPSLVPGAEQVLNESRKTELQELIDQVKNRDGQIGDLEQKLAEAEVLNESLETEVKELSEHIKSKQEQIGSLETELSEANEQIRDLAFRFNKAEQENEVLTGVNKELTLQVEELSEPGTKSASPSTSVSTKGFTRNGTNYAFNFAKTVLKGQRRITAEDVLADVDLQDELINAKSQMIRQD